MRISLILATLGRRGPLLNLLESLALQRHSDFDVILVDQNPEAYLDEILVQYRNRLAIKHLRSAPGLSRARNVALAALSGEAFALVDDDSLFEPCTLQHASQALEAADIVVGNLCPPKSLATPQPKEPNARMISPGAYGVFKGMPSATLFFRRQVRDLVGGFDESLGLGSGTGLDSGEETDYLVRCVRADMRFCRAPGVRIFHPLPDYIAPDSHQKARAYGRGRRAVIMKHQLGMAFLALNVVYPLLSAQYPYFNISQLRWRWHMSLGRLGL